MQVALIAALGTPMAPACAGLVWSVVVPLVVVVHSCMLLVHLAPTCADAGPDLLQLALVVCFFHQLVQIIIYFICTHAIYTSTVVWK